MTPLSSPPPPESPPEVPAASRALPTFEITDLSNAQKKWQLAVHEGHLALSETPGAQPYILLREGFPKQFNYSERLRALSVVQPFKVTLKLTPEATTAVTQWFGAAFLARTHLRRRYSFVLPWAAVWILLSLPLPGDASAGLEGKAFDLMNFGLGTTLVAAWACAKWRPHPILFLVDSLWFSFVTVQLTLNVLGGRSKLWLFLVVFLGGMAVTGLLHFLRFRHTKISRA